MQFVLDPARIFRGGYCYRIFSFLVVGAVSCGMLKKWLYPIFFVLLFLGVGQSFALEKETKDTWNLGKIPFYTIDSLQIWCVKHSHIFIKEVFKLFSGKHFIKAVSNRLCKVRFKTVFKLKIKRPLRNSGETFFKNE